MAIQAPRSISILCLNPALDVSYNVATLIPDQKSRVQSTRHDPGGNGINIGRAMQRLNIEADTFCVIAGAVGQILKSLLAQQLERIVYEEVSGETRINTTIVETDTKTQYQITDSGTDIPDAQLQRVVTDFLAVTDCGYGILTGSFQPSVSPGLYADLIKQIHHNGGRAVIDCHGEALRLAIEAGPFLIKPNQYELESLLETRFDSVEDIAKCGRQLQLSGVENVCVSLGAEGALLVSPDNSFFAKALDVPVNTTVGAGDSMVAGLVAGFEQYDDPEQALKWGIACGAGTVMHPGTELFSGDEIADFRNRVSVRKLDI